MKKTNRVLPALFFLWAAFVLWRYFSIPADPFQLLLSAFEVPGKGGGWDFGSFLHLGGILVSGLAVAWLVYHLGSGLQDWLGTKPSDPWLGTASGFSLGVLLVSFLWLGLGLVHLWYRPLMRVILAVLFLFSLPGLSKRLARFKVRGPSDRLSFWFLMAASAYLGLSFLHAFLPETHPDGLVYHLGTLSFWLFHHGIADLPSQPLAHFPFGGELFFLTGLLLDGTETAKFLNGAALALLALAAGGWAQELSGAAGKWLPFFLVATLPLAHLVCWTTQVEVLQSLFLLLFFYGLARLSDDPKKKGGWILLTGLWGGMALCVKYTSVLGLAAGFGAFLLGPSGRKAGARALAGVALTVLAVSGAWWLKNWVYAGDPFYPYLEDWFSGRKMTPAGFLTMTQDQGLHSFSGWHWWDFPWRLFVAKPSLFGFAGPLPLVLAPLFLLFLPLKGMARFLGTALLILWPLGLAVTGILKFHLPALVLTLLLLGALLGKEKGGWASRAGGIGLLSALACLPFLAGMSGFYYSGGGIWSGGESRSHYLNRVVRNPYQDLCAFAEKLPADSRLLIVGDARGLYYPRDFYADTGYDQPFLSTLFQRNLDLAGVQREMRKKGFTHLVVNGPQGITASSVFPAYPLSAAQWKSLDDYFRRGLDPLYVKGFQSVFEIRKDLKEAKDVSFVNPVLFFSEPAVRLLEAGQRGDRDGVERHAEEARRLFPFSGLWKDPESVGKALAGGRDGSGREVGDHE